MDLVAVYQAENFSTLHGDLITEIFSGQRKRQAGPHRTGVSTNIKATNRWIRTTNIYAKLRVEVMKKIKTRISSVHKESTPSGIRLHLSHVKSLKDRLKGYGPHPFGEGPARNISTGKEVALEIIAVLLDSPKLGDDRYKPFVNERLVTGKVDFFSPIKRVALNTGCLSYKKKTKTSQKRAEGTHTNIYVPKPYHTRRSTRFWLATFCKNVNLDVALSIQSLVYPDGTLRDAPKYLFRNDLISNAKALENLPPENARWIIDNMAAIRCVKPKDTYRAWIKSFLDFVTPYNFYSPIALELVSDTYLEKKRKEYNKA